jgi:cyclopropane-fatty-acyl-phospholipid synthase
MNEVPRNSRRDALEPHFDDVQAHYDLSNEFFQLFLDPTQTYSCAYFEREDMTLEEAQIAKIDLALGKLGLQPGMTLLDIGCGWGATMLRAIEKYDVNVVGLTLSNNQQEHVQDLFDTSSSTRVKRVLLEGWEQFDEQVDRIVSIGAFEHFGHERYPDFFTMAHHALPADGIMLLHTITGKDVGKAKELGLPLTFSLALRQIHHDRNLPRRSAALDRDGRRTRRPRTIRGDPSSATAVALRKDPGHLGCLARSAPRRGDQDPVR